LDAVNELPKPTNGGRYQMKKNRYQAEPVLTIGEGEDVPGGSAYIRLAEYVEISGLENADV
jgi:hypothetical protein